MKAPGIVIVKENNMSGTIRNFIGKVTRHTERTGVTLRARITSPSGKITEYKDFKCMVKPIGLTDEQAVIADLNYISNKLIANGVTGIKNNITSYMPSVGPNETNVSYKVTGTDIGDYFNSDGVVIKRPSYGENAVVGTLTVTVKKNAAVAEREITISIDPYTIEEVKDSITEEITWNTIRGKNWAESSDEATNGPSNVMYPLSLISSVKSPLINGNVNVTWKIVSDALETVMDGNDRIDLSNGQIYRPKFIDMFNAKEQNYTIRNLITSCTSKIDGNVSKTFMRLGGLVLKAEFTVSDTSASITIDESVSFNIKTLSMPVMNADVSAWMLKHVNQYYVVDSRYNNSFSVNSSDDGEENARSVFMDISTEASNASILNMYTKNDIIRATQNNELTGEYNGVKLTSMQWSVILPSSMGEGKTPVALTGGGQSAYSKVGLNSPVSNADEKLQIILDPDKLPTDMRLVLRATLSFAQYEGPVSSVTVFYWFICNDATPEQITPPDTGNSGDGNDGSGSGDGGNENEDGSGGGTE